MFHTGTESRIPFVCILWPVYQNLLPVQNFYVI